MKKYVLFLTVVSLLMTMVAGCGSASGGQTTAPTQATTEPATIPTEDTTGWPEVTAWEQVLQ